MLGHVAPLDELFLILLLDRHEHPQNVAQQVAAAFRYAVEKHRLVQRGLLERTILLVEVVRHDVHNSH
jgi:hypothetical protein